jgi:hypothetical protein
VVVKVISLFHLHIACKFVKCVFVVEFCWTCLINVCVWLKKLQIVCK